MAHQRYTFGFTGEDETSHREDRFSPQNEADYERLARIAAAEAAGTDLLLDVEPVHKGYEQKLLDPVKIEEADLGSNPNVTEYHYEKNPDN